MSDKEPEFGGIVLSRTPEWVVRDLWQSGKISNEDYSSELFRRAKETSDRQAYIAKLEARVAELESTVRIRQLSWDDNRVNHQALGPFGFIYYVTKSADFDGYSAGWLGDFDTLAAAKAAVQTHFEKGILASFDAPPPVQIGDE